MGDSGERGRGCAVGIGLALAATLITPEASAQAPRVERLGDVEVSWRFEAGRLHGEVSAPTEGWLLVGFNGQGRGLERARLFFFVVEGDGECRGEEHLATPPRHARRAGASSLLVHSCGRRAGRAWARFSIASDAPGGGLVRLTPGRAVELIGAYSVSPDLEHHSRQRRHRALTL